MADSNVYIRLPLDRWEAMKEEKGLLEEALRGLLGMYVALVNSGDAGGWNPEEGPEVIAARRALDRAETVAHR